MAGGGIRSLRLLRLRLSRQQWNGCCRILGGAKADDDVKLEPETVPCGEANDGLRVSWECDCIYTTAFHVFLFLFCLVWVSHTPWYGSSSGFLHVFSGVWGLQ